MMLISTPPLTLKETKIYLWRLGFVPVHVTDPTAENQRKDEAQALNDPNTDANAYYNAHVAFQCVEQFSDTPLQQS